MGTRILQPPGMGLIKLVNVQILLQINANKNSHD